MDKIAISINDVQLSQLNSECLLLVAKFARELKTYSGQTLVMQEPHVLVKISNRARRTRNKELKKIYAELKDAMLRSIHETLNSKQ